MLQRVTRVIPPIMTQSRSHTEASAHDRTNPSTTAAMAQVSVIAQNTPRATGPAPERRQITFESMPTS